MDFSKTQRETPQRRLILECVRARNDHPDAETIYREVHARDSRISKATVYRNLNLLAAKGDILPIRLSDADRFDRTLTDHAHIRCCRCARVIDAPRTLSREAYDSMEQESGFRILRRQTVYEGICPDCILKEQGEQP